MDEQQIIKELIERLTSNLKDLKPEYSKIVDEHFWELI